MSLSEQWRAWRLLQRCSSLSAASSEGDHVRVSGVVRALDETVTAPLSAREGVVVRARVRATSHFHESASIRELLLVTRFAVEVDGTTCVVDGEHLVLDVPYVRLPASNGGRELAFLARHGLKPVRASFREQVIAPGDRVTVGGVLLHELHELAPRAERGFRERAPPRPRLVGSPAHPVVVRGRRK